MRKAFRWTVSFLEIVALPVFTLLFVLAANYHVSQAGLGGSDRRAGILSGEPTKCADGEFVTGIDEFLNETCLVSGASRNILIGGSDPKGHNRTGHVGVLGGDTDFSPEERASNFRIPVKGKILKGVAGLRDAVGTGERWEFRVNVGGTDIGGCDIVGPLPNAKHTCSFDFSPDICVNQGAYIRGSFIEVGTLSYTGTGFMLLFEIDPTCTGGVG